MVNTMTPTHTRNSRNPKSITFIITTLVYGGAQTQVLALMKLLKDRGWQPSIISMIEPEAFTEELAEMGIPVASLDMGRGSADPRALLKLRRILNEWQPSIIHSHMVHANLLARIARVFTKMPILISTAHNINEGGRIREIGYRLTDPLCDLTTNVSQAAVDRYVDIGAAPKNKIELMVNGLDASRFTGFSETDRKAKRAELGLGDAFTWLAVGRYDVEKDYPNLISAFKQVQKSQDSKLLIVGHGPINIMELAKEHGVENQVQDLGIRKDIPALMNAVDAYVMSSAWEGLPMVLLEAAASSLPIVTTNVGGNAEIVQHNQTGYVVPHANADALAKAMLELENLSPEQRQSFGLAGRSFVQENYDLEKIVSQWEDIYNSYLDKKSLLQNA